MQFTYNCRLCILFLFVAAARSPWRQQSDSSRSAGPYAMPDLDARHLALGTWTDRCRSLSPYYGTVNAPRGVLAMPAAIKVGDTVLMPDTPLVGVTGGDGGEF